MEIVWGLAFAMGVHGNIIRTILTRTLWRNGRARARRSDLRTSAVCRHCGVTPEQFCGVGGYGVGFENAAGRRHYGEVQHSSVVRSIMK